MTKELAEFLKAANEHCGDEQNFEIREDYSGRGMMGHTTCGVVIDSLPMLLLNVIQYVRELKLVPSRENPHPTIRDYIPDASEMGHLRTDNMAQQIILY